MWKFLKFIVHPLIGGVLIGLTWHSPSDGLGAGILMLGYMLLLTFVAKYEFASFPAYLGLCFSFFSWPYVHSQIASNVIEGRFMPVLITVLVWQGIVLGLVVFAWSVIAKTETRRSQRPDWQRDD